MLNSSTGGSTMNRQTLITMLGVPFLAVSLVYIYGLYVFYALLFALVF